MLTLEIGGKLAHKKPVEPNNRNVLRHGHWHANQCHQKICHRQVDQKIIGDTTLHIKRKQFIVKLALLRCIR